jgi:ribose transport system permease protein
MNEITKAAEKSPLASKGSFSEFWSLNKPLISSFIIVIVLTILGEILVPGFAAPGHLLLMVKAAAFIGIICLAQATVIFSGGGGIDLSVGHIATLGVFFGAIFMNGKNEYIIPAVLAVGVIGLILGLVSGYFVAYIKIHPLIVTVAMGLIAYGIVIIYGQGRRIVGSPAPIVEFLANGRVFGFPVIIIVWGLFVVVADFILLRTRTGQALLSVGANDVAANLSGVKVNFFRLLVYGASGVISAVFGILLLGYIHQPFWDVGVTYIFPSVIAAVIGGVAITGGSGRYLGSVGGALVVTVLNSLLISVKMDASYRQAIFGLVLIGILLAYAREDRQ